VRVRKDLDRYVIWAVTMAAYNLSLSPFFLYTMLLKNANEYFLFKFVSPSHSLVTVAVLYQYSGTLRFSYTSFHFLLTGVLE